MSTDGALPTPIERSNLRMTMGSLYFSSKRFIGWYLNKNKYAVRRITRQIATDRFPHVIADHQSITMRELRNVDMWMQSNKVRNLELAVNRMDSLVLKPGETMSLWRLIGRPSKRKGYLPGMVLINGEMRSGYGGGLCQLSNLIYWMTLHTDLTVTERYRHQYDVFPDSHRTLPFGSGATIAYNYIDLQIRNDTKNDFLLNLQLSSESLRGAWRCTVPARYRYEVVERNHHITQHTSGRYLRHNEIWRKKIDYDGNCLGEEFVTDNHAIMMYSPLLPSSVIDSDGGF